MADTNKTQVQPTVVVESTNVPVPSETRVIRADLLMGMSSIEMTIPSLNPKKKGDMRFTLVTVQRDGQGPNTEFTRFGIFNSDKDMPKGAASYPLLIELDGLKGLDIKSKGITPQVANRILNKLVEIQSESGLPWIEHMIPVGAPPLLAVMLELVSKHLNIEVDLSNFGNTTRYKKASPLDWVNAYQTVALRNNFYDREDVRDSFAQLMSNRATVYLARTFLELESSFKQRPVSDLSEADIKKLEKALPEATAPITTIEVKATSDSEQDGVLVTTENDGAENNKDGAEPITQRVKPPATKVSATKK